MPAVTHPVRDPSTDEGTDDTSRFHRPEPTKVQSGDIQSLRDLPWPDCVQMLMGEAAERRDQLLDKREDLDDEWDLFLCDLAISAQCNVLFISYFGPVSA
ncbi:MAG TPA: hypothetical protein VLF21_00375 [Candidatus Saccharimonadales bacterium]|nr:hypothetical protein [Candidatus Saccharimonadales bacterium]